MKTIITFIRSAIVAALLATGMLMALFVEVGSVALQPLITVAGIVMVLGAAALQFRWAKNDPVLRAWTQFCMRGCNE